MLIFDNKKTPPPQKFGDYTERGNKPGEGFDDYETSRAKRHTRQIALCHHAYTPRA